MAFLLYFGFRFLNLVFRCTVSLIAFPFRMVKLIMSRPRQQSKGGLDMSEGSYSPKAKKPSERRREAEKRYKYKVKKADEHNYKVVSRETVEIWDQITSWELGGGNNYLILCKIEYTPAPTAILRVVENDNIQKDRYGYDKIYTKPIKMTEDKSTGGIQNYILLNGRRFYL